MAKKAKKPKNDWVDRAYAGYLKMPLHELKREGWLQKYLRDRYEGTDHYPSGIMEEYERPFSFSEFVNNLMGDVEMRMIFHSQYGNKEKPKEQTKEPDMKKEYAYVFVAGGKIVWSKETNETLLNRADNEHDKNLILDFMESGHIGSFILLQTGEFISRTN